MKVVVGTILAENEGYFGGVSITLTPETDEEIDLFERVGDNHARLCDEESNESIVEIRSCCTTPPMEMEILFIKPTVPHG